ncbi:hypothetical protein SESBI_22960 [Sesbania bispinosa]|nr:hypothetical protein SESBI_22960 [Sesbania bispinosa]
MANSTQSSRNAKDEENNNGRVTQNGEKGKTKPKSNSNASDPTGLRRSTREPSSKKIIPSPSSTRKSERIEKRTPPTPAVKRKPEEVETKKMPSLLRRSGRTRSHSSSSPSDSKSSGTSSSKQKPKKEKSVKQLTFEAKEVNENEEDDLGNSQVKIKRMDARIYRSIFKNPKKEPNGIGKSNKEGDNNKGGKIGECSKRSHTDCKEVSKNGTLPSEASKAKETGDVFPLSEPGKGSVVPSNAPTYETSVVPERVQPDCCGEETLQMSVSRNSILDEGLVRNIVGHDGGEKSVPSKRKGITVDMDSDVSASLSKDDNCNMIPNSSPSRLADNIVGADGSCSKRIRLDNNPTVNESCNTSATELHDRDDIDASMLQKDCPANVAKNLCSICKSEGEGQLL